MKLKNLLVTLLLLAVGGFASASITSGYYRIKSYNSKYLTENTSSHELICSDLIGGNYSQVWYLNVSGTSVTFENVLTDRYIQGQGSFSQQYSTGLNTQSFTIGEAENIYTFEYDSYNQGGLHCDNSNVVVEWSTSDEKSKWTIESVTVDNAALAAQKAAISEASTTDLLKVFTTTACTELKGSYSESDLAALPSSTQALATKIKNNTWATYSGWDKTEKTFRIADYKAYSSHERWTSIIGLSHSFGRLTNPTGISVSGGDYLQVYVGAIPSGQSVKLEVAGQYQAAGTTYALEQGMNVLLMASGGNCFVQYEVDNTTSGSAPYTALSSYADVTVHIEGGTVNGYFDLTKGDDNEDWANLRANLLDGTSVDIKTNNLLFHMTTDLVTAACPSNMVELLGEWDKILDMEHSLMGLESFDGYWNNLLSATDMTGDSYMHATTYGTFYNVTTVPSVMSYADMFAGGTLWGPAHENGHIFQKYINMVGQTEVSNNVFSNVAVYNNGHLTSRASNISVTFENMANNVFWNDRDIWERTHLYFQLYQFFHILGNDPDFYPELFKAFRSDPMVHEGNTFISATDDYLKFYKKCCQVSGYDLTEFFQAYGFFVIPELASYTLDEVTKDAYKVDDYGNYYLTVTQEEIDAAKAEVAAMSGLKKANIIFIEDRITAPDATYEGVTAGTKKTAFSNEYPIGQAGETGQYTTFGATCSAYKYNVKDGAVTMEGTGAVGFKVYDSTGNLRGLYNTYNFALPDGIGTGYVIKAAAGDGTDAEATFDATVGVIVSDVTDAGFIKAGSQITAESQLVSGQLYLIYYVGNGSSAYMKDTGSAYTGKDDNNAALNAVYQFFRNSDGTWKVQNYATGKYWGTPTANANSYIGSDTPGSWALNFQSNNYVAPSCNGHSWNRSGSNVHPWSTGTANVNQFKITEVSPATELADEFDDKDVSVSSEAAASLETGKWYVMFDRGVNHGYLYENGENKLYNTATAPSGSATDNAKYLVRIVGWNNEYYIQTGLGNFFGKIQQSTNVPTTTTATEQITIKKIADTDGHFYLMSADGIVLDANDLTQGDGTVVGWGNTAPSETGKNNDWAFYPVEFVDSWIPAISEVYTINNTNTSRGAMMYNSASNYVWSSGKSGTFSATDPNCQWVLVPTGIAKQYYLYNVGAGKFAIPSGTASTASWVFSDDAVAVMLIKQSDGTFKIKTATTDTYAAVSNGYNGPIINYNDVGGNFTVTKVDGDQSTAATAAYNKLADNVTPLSSAPTGEGWYIIRIKQHGTYADKYVYQAASEIAYKGINYPLTFEHGANIRPAISDVTYYSRIVATDGGFNWQLTDGRYLFNNVNKFPVATTNATDISVTYVTGSGFRLYHNNGTYTRYAVPYLLESKYFIGETASMGNAYFDLYPINLSDAGLTAWKVVINGASASTKLTCTRNDVNGLTAVYNNGYFFLPTGVTPASSEFSLTGMISCDVDENAKTINVEYDPELSILITDVVVNQGNQTTGKGNTMQALLRIKATPFSDFQPTQFSINLTGASNVDNVKVYSTTSDQIRFAGVTPTLLGTAVSPSDGTVNIDVTSSSVNAGTTLYYWITADVKSTAAEWETIDASLASVSYTNAYKQDNTLDVTTLDLSSVGNPVGEMRIYKQQSELWTASMAGSQYYRIPTIIQTADGGILALTDDRHNNSGDLGSHKIDVVARKSMDSGLTWGNEITVAVGDGSSDAAYGYGDPAVVRTLNDKLICLMAAGKASYASGQLHMGYSESTDNGATWTAPIDIYSSISKPEGVTFQSVFTSAGKGVTFSNGRVAFAMNGKVNGTTNEYIIYSDDEGASWTLSTEAAFTGADESKLEIMNDNSLLVTVRRGGFNSQANRGYNRTTGDASGDGVNDWGTQGIWGNEMNANGCNADILYYNRETENAGRPDVIFHTLTKTYSTFRKDLRLYMSFDQGVTWKEAFQLQPGYAAYSSMQKLANGDLAIIFEDGSIGNEDKQDCYAITYVVLSSEIVNAKIDELYEALHYPIATIISQGETSGSAPWGTWSPTSGWANGFTTNASAGVAGVTVTTSDNSNLLNRETDYGQRVFCIKPSAAGTTDEFVITAPDGYIIKGYSIGGFYWKGAEKYTLTSADGTRSANVNKNSGTPDMLSVDNIYAKSTSFKMTSLGTTNEKFACITQFTVTLSDLYPLALSKVGDASYATLYLPFGITLPNEVTAYKITVNHQKKTAVPESIEQTLPANTPALLISDNGVVNATAIVNSEMTPDTDNNVLVGTTSAGYVDGYVLNAVDNQIGFYKLDSTGSLSANRAYIPSSIVVGSQVKAFLLSDGTETGVSQTEALENDETYYSLSGVKVKGKPTVKGVFIQPGRKVVVK